MSAHQMTPIAFARGLRDVCLAAMGAAPGSERGAVGDLGPNGVTEAWVLLVFFDLLDPEPVDGEIAWNYVITTALVRRDDSGDTTLGTDEYERALNQYLQAWNAVYKLIGGAGSPRAGTPFDGKHLVLMLPDEDDAQRGIAAAGLFTGGETRIGSKWRGSFRGPEPA